MTKKQKTPIAKDMPKHFANRIYRLACSDPYLWVCKAQEVKRSADILWAKFVKEIKEFSNSGIDVGPSTGSIALMLYGLAIENLLKAGLAEKGLLAAKNGKFNKKSHDLFGLAMELDIALDDKEAELIERLQNFIEWAGRYPIPLYREGLYPREFLDGSKCSICGLSTGDGDRVNEIIKKIESVLPTEDEAVERYARNYGD